MVIQINVFQEITVSFLKKTQTKGSSSPGYEINLIQLPSKSQKTKKHFLFYKWNFETIKNQKAESSMSHFQFLFLEEITARVRDEMCFILHNKHRVFNPFLVFTRRNKCIAFDLTCGWQTHVIGQLRCLIKMKMLT